MWMQCYVCELGLCGHSMQNRRPLECCGFIGTSMDMVFCECSMWTQCSLKHDKCIVEIVNMVSMTLQCSQKLVKQHICNLVLVDMVEVNVRCQIKDHWPCVHVTLFIQTWFRWMFNAKLMTIKTM